MSDEIGGRLTPELSDAGGPLECEIYPSTNHAKVVVWTIHYIPTKIVYPADMRCKANFDATAKLADSPRFRTGLFSPNSSHANRACALGQAFSAVNSVF